MLKRYVIIVAIFVAIVPFLSAGRLAELVVPESSCTMTFAQAIDKFNSNPAHAEMPITPKQIAILDASPTNKAARKLLHDDIRKIGYQAYEMNLFYALDPEDELSPAKRAEYIGSYAAFSLEDFISQAYPSSGDGADSEYPEDDLVRTAAFLVEAALRRN